MISGLQNSRDKDKTLSRYCTVSVDIVISEGGFIPFDGWAATDISLSDLGSPID